MFNAVIIAAHLAWILLFLVVTVLVECGLSLLFRSRELTYCVFLCNLLTNPLVNLLLILYSAYFPQEYYVIALAILEIAVVGVEAFIIALMTGMRPPKALLLSLFFNAASCGVGILFQKGVSIFLLQLL